jgi:hypothetical protein
LSASVDDLSLLGLAVPMSTGPNSESNAVPQPHNLVKPHVQIATQPRMDDVARLRRLPLPKVPSLPREETGSSTSTGWSAITPSTLSRLSSQDEDHAFVQPAETAIPPDLTSTSEQLKKRGKGSYTCPYGTACQKGGLTADGQVREFQRNSDFRCAISRMSWSLRCG